MSTATDTSIPVDPKTASDLVKSGSLAIVDDPDTVDSGEITEKFTISVKSTDKTTGEVTTHYESSTQPFRWNKVASFPGIFASESAPLTDDQVSFLGDAFPGEEQGKVLLKLVSLYNDNSRNRAKANEYQRIMNLMKPVTEEDKAAAIDNAARNVAKAFGISLDKAKEMVLSMKS